MGSNSSKPANSNIGISEDVKFNEPKSSQILLEDLPPKFEDEGFNKPKSEISEGEKLLEAVKMIQPQDFLNLHKIPCFRDSMLTGIAGGSVAFVVLITLRAKVLKASNWAVITWGLSSMYTWQKCQNIRLQERRVAAATKQIAEKRLAENEAGKLDK